MKTFCAVKITVFATAVVVAHCFRDGARDISCVDMKPGHGDVQNTTSPYVLEIDGGTTTYSANKEVLVCIVERNFDGLLLQARRVDGNSDSPIGRFSDDQPEGTKVLRCREDGDSVTHADNMMKPAGTCFSWFGPATDYGRIHFVATITEGMNMFWVDVTSKTLSPAGYSGSTTTHPGGAVIALTVLTTWVVYMLREPAAL